MKKCVWFTLLMFILSSCTTAQNDGIYIEKKECISENRYNGYKLVIHYTTKSLTKSTNLYDYHLDFFKDASDALKLQIIEKLLQYNNDTTLCCLKINNYNFNGIEGCRGKPKEVIRYTIQVDALYMINRLCWPKLIELYSCTPVLYDTLAKKEINSEPQKIKLVFGEYEKWYKECKAKGKIDDYFPFNDGRYVWYGGRKSGIAKE